MKPFRTLAETRTPDGSRFTLHEHDGEYFLKLNGRQLMSTTSTASELQLAELPCRRLRGHAKPAVLIGGLGLGYSLQRVLEIVGPTPPSTSPNCSPKSPHGTANFSAM